MRKKMYTVLLMYLSKSVGMHLNEEARMYEVMAKQRTRSLDSFPLLFLKKINC